MRRPAGRSVVFPKTLGWRRSAPAVRVGDNAPDGDDGGLATPPRALLPRRVCMDAHARRGPRANGDARSRPDPGTDANTRPLEFRGKRWAGVAVPDGDDGDAVSSSGREHGSASAPPHAVGRFYDLMWGLAHMDSKTPRTRTTLDHEFAVSGLAPSACWRWRHCETIGGERAEKPRLDLVERSTKLFVWAPKIHGRGLSKRRWSCFGSRAIIRPRSPTF